MKPKYLLESYDQLLRDLSNPKNISDQKCIEAIQKITTESFVSYKVIFNQRKNTIDYTIEYPIHNLNPHAVSFENLKPENHLELERHVPSILKELNLTEANPKLHWSSAKGIKILYLLVDTKLEALSKNNLLFIYYYQMAKSVNNKIKNRCKDQIFAYNSNNKTKQFIHKMQASISVLLTRTMTEIKPESVKDLYELSNHYQKTDYLKIIYIHVEKLLRFLEKEYPNHIDENGTVPLRTLLIEQLKQAHQLQLIKSKFTAYCSNKKLLDFALEPIQKITEITLDKNVNYHQLQYGRQYIAACYDFFKTNITADENDIRNLLIELNYNSITLFAHMVDNIIASLNPIDTTNDKIKYLFEIRKNLNQKPTKIIKPFYQEYPHIKSQIIGWIEEEIEFFQSSAHLTTKSHNVPGAIAPKGKIQTELSVAQLCYLFNLMHQSGVIKESNQRDIFRFIAENFKTKTTEQISIDSIKSRYYNVESTTKSAVREKIIELLNLAKI